MADFILLMKGPSADKEWGDYIGKLVGIGQFRGGSAFGNGQGFDGGLESTPCIATGYMRFEAAHIDDLELFLNENPTVKAGGSVEIHELIVTD